ncbi:MAG TPA: pitrilysin family protein [Kofleriaceae bacterium]|nr:pitrilysin family protein [Kofleriaceae bacterium]
MRKLALAALLGIAATCTPSTTKYSIKYTERHGTLKNGLRVIIVPDPTTQMAEVDVRYDVGSREDPPGKAGLAHLVEHLMFQQRPDGPTTPPLMHFIDQLTTFFNAYTNWDTTHYMQLSRADMVDSMLKIEAERMFYGCQTISEEEFEREREVVRNEIRWRSGNAEGQMEQMILSSVYPKGHAYERNVGGNDKQLATITLNDACEFMKKYYTTDRAVVVVAGGIDFDATSTLVQKWFGRIEARTPAPRTPVDPVVLDTKRADFTVDIERPMVHVAWALPPSNTPEGERVRFGISTVFFDTAQKAEDYDFATQVQPQFLGGELAPVFVISIELKSMDRLDEALDFVKKAAGSAARDFGKESDEQITWQKDRRKAQFIASIEPLTARTNQIAADAQFAQDVQFDSNETYLMHELAKIDQFDGGDVKDAVSKWLDPDKMKVIVVKNSKEGVHGDTRSNIAFQTQSDTGSKEVAEVDPREALKPLKVAATINTLNGAKRFELGNGMKVVLLSVDSLPLVAVDLQFGVGEANAPGVASYAAENLEVPWTEADADVKLKTLVAGLTPQCSAELETTDCVLHNINIYLPDMLESLERLIRRGDFNQEGIERFQKHYKDDIKRQDVQTDLEFNRQIAASLYGADHPYTKAAAIAPDVIDAIGRDKVASFVREHYSASNATLIIAGNFDLDKAEAAVRARFGGWGSGHKDAPIATDTRKRTGPEYIGVIGKEQPQTTVRIMFPAPAGIDGQEAARRVLAQMLNERMEDIRFKLGSTYGTYAAHVTHLGPSAYMMGGDIDTARTGESLKAMRAGIGILQHVAAGGASQEETNQFLIDFVRARRKLIQVLLGQSTVSSELARRLGTIAMFGQPNDFYNQLLQRVAAVSPAQIMALIQSELRPENEVIVTKGTREGIEKTFTDAGIANVKIIEPEYK